MATERVVQHEVRSTGPVSDGAGTTVERETTTHTETVQPAQPAQVVQPVVVQPVQPAQPANTNVNVNAPAPGVASGGQVNINTPDGTQVNINP